MIGSLRVGLAISMMTIVSLLLTPLQFIALKTGWFDPKLLPRAWHRLAVMAIGVRMHVRGRIVEGRPLLIAANHISWIDISVLSAIAEVSFIAKSEMAGWPVLGAFARLQRTIFVDRDRREKSAAQANEIAIRLAKGDAMVLFAEGTTADGNSMLPFKSSLFGAAGIAIDGKAGAVLVQPVAISYTRLHGMPMGRPHRPAVSWIGDSDLLPHLLALLREGAVDVEVEFGEPVEFTATSSRKDIARLVEDHVRRMRADGRRRPREK